MVVKRQKDDAKSRATGQRTHLSRSSFLTLTKNLRCCCSGGPIIAVMQTAEPWHCYNPAADFGVACWLSTGRRSLRQREMSSIVVIIADVIIHQSLQVPFIENDHMVEQIAAAITDPALGNAVLPRTSEAGPIGLDAEALHCVDNLFIELCAAIKDQIARSRIVGECLTQLLNNPGASWMPGHIAVKDTPPVMRDNEEAIQHAESQRRDGEEVHCRDGCSEKPPIALQVRDFEELFASSAGRFAPKCRSPASSTHRECVAHPRWGSRRPCGR